MTIQEQIYKLRVAYREGEITPPQLADILDGLLAQGELNAEEIELIKKELEKWKPLEWG